MKCVICCAPLAEGGGLVLLRKVTCSPACHEQYVARLEAQYGKFKHVIRAATGQDFRVPLRDIIEKGISEVDLDRYPPWEEDV